MINRIISFSIKNKLIIGLMVLALIGIGINSLMTIKLGSVPDITNNQVQVITVAPNLGTEDIEQFVTYPVELAMANLPGVIELRSISRFGLSVVTIVFRDNMGTYLPRQVVQEKLNDVKSEIPEGFGEPFMAPITTGLGEIYQYTLVPEEGYETVYSPTDLRTIQDWIVKRQMALVSGVVEINSFGGFVKQYEIALNPDKLKSMNITLYEVYEALERNNSNTGGAYIEKNHQANFIRGEGLARSIEEIEAIVIKTVNRSPILIRDVAEKVGFGSMMRFGAFTQDGREAVGGQVLMLKGENPNEVISNVKERIESIQKSLPEGLKIVPFIDRSDLIARTTSTVKKNLAEGALIVIFVLVLLLGSIRGGLITASIIPLSLLFAFIMMKMTGVWANLMSLGAIDFGIIVDGAVIIVEGVVHQIEMRVRKAKVDYSNADMDEIAYTAASKVMNSAFFGQLIILIVFTPILFLTGVEGKMFRPMAFTFGYAVLGALILGLTYVPAISAMALKPPKIGKKGLLISMDRGLHKMSEKLMSFIYKLYFPMIKMALKAKTIVVIIALALLILAGYTFSKMGGEFIPKLDEGDIAMQALIKPGSSLSESIEVSKKIEHILLENFPEVKSVMARIGVSEIPTDPMPMDIADCFIMMEKDMDKWVSAKSKPELIAKMNEALSVLPGVNYIFTQPVELRFNELLTGIREDVAIKLYGEDLNVLATKAQEMVKIIGTVDGAADIRAEATAGLPQITVRYNRFKVAQYGLDIDKLNQYVRSAFAGATAGVIFEGEKRFDLVIRLSEQYRKDIGNLKNLYVDVPNGEQVPLNEVADISYQPGPMQISRDNTYRRVSVGVNIRGRDVESMVLEIKSKLESQMDLPPGYYFTFGGSFENLMRAKQRLSIVVPIALGLIFVLLYFALHSLVQSVMIYMAVPLAAIGGIFALAMRGMPFSISAGVGFVVLFGVAVLNGLVLISRLNSLKEEGMIDIRERIYMATKERLRPILLTALAAIMGFLPMAISVSAGAEVQRPLATVVIGGLITATFLTLVVVPVLYYFVESLKGRRKRNKGIATAMFIGLISFSGLFSNDLQAQDFEKLNLEQAVDTALTYNPLLKSANLRVEREETLRKSTFDIFDTDVSYTRGQLNSTIQDYSLELFQGFKFPTTYITQSNLQKQKVELSKQAMAINQNDLIRQVKSVYILSAFIHSRLSLLKELDTIYADFARSAQLRYSTGESNILEKTAAQGKYREVKLQKVQAEADLKMYHNQLQRLLNIDKPVDIMEEGITDLILELPGDSAGFSRNPLMSFYRQRISVMEFEKKLQDAQFAPDIGGGYFNQQIDGTAGMQGWMIGVTIPLGFWSKQAKSQAAKVDVEIAGTEYESMQLGLRTQFESILQQYVKYKAEVDYYESQGLNIADELVNFAKIGYKEGEIGYVEYIQNLDQAFNIRRQYLESLNYLKQTIIEINYLMGIR
jgi:heavy metal efflux system protein